MKAFKPESTLAKIMLYGVPGSGKTTVLGTVVDDPRTHPCLWLDCGGNPEVIRNNPVLPTILQIERPVDLNAPYDWLLKGQPESHSFTLACEKLGVSLTPPYNSVVIDCMTELQRMYIREFTGNENKQPGEAMNPVEIREWGTTLNALINMISEFKKLTMHLFVTCHEDDKHDKQGNFIRTTVWLWGQGRVEVPAYLLAQLRLVRTNNVPGTVKEKMSKMGVSDAINIAYFDQIGPFDAKQQYVKKRLGWMPSPTITKILDVLEIK